MSKQPSKQIPLVIYKGGERLVVGMAYIDPDGSIHAQIAKDLRADVKEIIGTHLGEVSLNPERPRPIIVNDPPRRLVRVDPPKIQEPKDVI